MHRSNLAYSNNGNNNIAVETKADKDTLVVNNCTMISTISFHMKEHRDIEHHLS